MLQPFCNSTLLVLRTFSFQFKVKEGAMAPKQSKADTDKTVKGGKRKAEDMKEAIEDKAPEAGPAPERINRGQCSAMLTLLKYRSDPDKNKKGLLLHESQKALQVYAQLPMGSKPNFIRDFELGKKTGNMSFVNTYSETIENSKVEVSTVSKQFLNGSQILRLNGLEPKDYNDAKQDKLLEHLLSEAESKFSYAREMEENKEFAELTKYKYWFDQGEKVEVRKKESDTFNIAGGVDKKALDNMVSAGSSGDKGIIKIENPLAPKLKDAMGALKSAKSLLEKKWNEGQDLLATTIGIPSQEEKTTVKDFPVALKVVNVFVDELRVFIAKMDKIKVPDVVQQNVDEAEKKKALAMIHLDSYKEKLRNLKLVL